MSILSSNPLRIFYSFVYGHSLIRLHRIDTLSHVIIIFTLSLLLFINTLQAYATPTVPNLLTNEIISGNIVLIFEPSSGMTNEITCIHLHFLTGNDCYSGYISGFITDKATPSFSAIEHVPFSLRATSVYEAAAISVRTTKLSNIHSVLVRFISYERGNPYDRFARFTGTCQDQDINCCIPVDCSEATRTCLPKHELPIQPIFWR